MMPVLPFPKEQRMRKASPGLSRSNSNTCRINSLISFKKMLKYSCATACITRHYHLLVDRTLYPPLSLSQGTFILCGTVLN